MSHSIYEIAKEQFAAVGVDTEAALQALDKIPVSMHCKHEPLDPSTSLGFENMFGPILREVDSLSTEYGRLLASALCCA